MLNIGQKIKALRKKQDVTQEKLAAYLNISYQAVSKWENGTALPDITLLPQIASFFGVTSDELLGLKENRQTEELKEYEKAYFDYRRKGKILESIKVARDVLINHPRNFQWMLNLCYSLIQYNATDEQRAYSKEHKFEEEAITLCERILEDCTNDSIRHSAIQILCCSYPHINKTDEAIRLANKMPDFYLSREQLLTHIYRGEEQIKACQELFMRSIGTICGLIWMLNSNDLMGKELTSAQRIELSQKAILLLDLMFDNDKENGFWLMHKERTYERIAKIYAKENDTENVIKCLLFAEKCVIKAAENDAKGETKYNSLIANRLTYNPKNFLTNSEETNTSFLLMTITQDKYISKLKDTPEIVSLIERLKKF